MGKVKKVKSRGGRLANPYQTKKVEKPLQKTTQPKRILPPTIPFEPEDRILLVGEGDFSFAASLVDHHCCSSITATTLESHSSLLEKHPQAAEHIANLGSSDQRVLFDIDATKLGSPHGGGGAALRKGLYQRIIFNFPHVGGITKDVNRQVRANQELIVGFFKSAILILADGGSIVVTIFEGEPYDLWNLRDLGRHAGLKVGRSFAFQAHAFPGYHHARSLGNVHGGGGWKGEDRKARSYCFERPDRDSPKQKAKDSDDED